MRIPDNKIWKGTYTGNYFGNLWQTWNIDLEQQPGRIMLSDKMRIFKAALGVVAKFIRTDATATDQWWGIVHDTDIIHNTSSVITSATWVTDATAGTFNDPRDMIIHEFANGEQRLLCTRATNIAILNSAGVANAWDDDWWTAVAGGSALTSLAFHPMAKLGRLVAVGDKVTGVPVIHTIDQNDVIAQSRVTLPTGYTVRLALASSSRFWFGLQSDTDGSAKIIEWDGFSLTYNNEYDLVGSSPLTGFLVNNIPYFITEKGFIFRYNGAAFAKVQDFNLQEQRMILTTTITNEDTIKPHGAYVDGDIVYLNVGIPMINAQASATTLNGGVRRARSGIWIFNTKTNNLYHHMGFGEHTTAGTDLSYGCAHVDEPGTVIKSTTGGDYILIASASVFNGGATWIAGATNGIYRMIRSNDQASNAGRNRGYFITPYIPIADIEATWEALWVKFKRFVNSNNRIVVKWRTADPLFNASAQDPDTNNLILMNAQGTWVNTTSFTAIVPTGVAVGDEVEVLSGDNAGCSFAISTLSATPDSVTSITVTIAEAAPTASTDKFLCRFDNWTTETAISSTSVGNQKVPFTGSTRNTHGEFIQLKIELRGFDVAVDELQPIFKVKTSPQQG